MISLKTYALSILGLATLVQSLVLPLDTTPSVAARDEASGLLILDKYAYQGYEITIYGDDPSSELATEEDPAIQRRCGSNQVACSASNRGYSHFCTMLFDHLRTKGSLPVSPRSVCLAPTGTANVCCVSWAKNVSGLHGSHLVNAAVKTYNQCVDGDTVAGKARDANLNGVCTTQCLSNRPDGCSP